MATKNINLVKDQHNSIGSKAYKYSNLNLNQNHKCVEKVRDVKQNFGPKNKHFYNGDDMILKGEKSMKKDSFVKKQIEYFDNLGRKEDHRKQWKKHEDKSHDPSGSTLSLHIAAYEDLQIALPDKKCCQPRHPILLPSYNPVLSATRDLLEFPRQAEERAPGEPEVMQFKASQKLLNPNDRVPDSFLDPAIPPVEHVIDLLCSFNKEELGKKDRGTIWSTTSSIKCLGGVSMKVGITVSGKKNERMFNCVISFDDYKYAILDPSLELSIQSASVLKPFGTFVEQGNGVMKAEIILGSKSDIFDEENAYFVDGEMGMKITGKMAITLSPVYVRQIPIKMTVEFKKEDLLKVADQEYVEVAKRLPGIDNLSLIFRCFPNGDSDSSRGNACFVISMPEAKADSRLSISIKSAYFSTTFRKYFNEDVSEKIICCETNEFWDKRMEYLKKKRLIVEVQGIIMLQRLKPLFLEFKLKALPEVASQFYPKFRRSKIALVIGTKEIKVERRIIASHCIKIRDLISADEKLGAITIDGYEHEIVEAVCHLLENKKLPKTFGLQSMLMVLKFSVDYQIAAMKEEVFNFITKWISPANIADIFCFADNYNLDELRSECLEKLRTFSADSIPINHFIMEEEKVATLLEPKAVAPASPLENLEQPPIHSSEAETAPVCADLGNTICTVVDPPEDCTQEFGARVSDENKSLMEEIQALTQGLQINDDDPHSEAFHTVKVIYRDLPQHRGTKIVIENSTFTIQDLLNEGSSGIVYRVSDDSGTEYAMKVSKLIKNANFVKEMKIAKLASDSGMEHFCNVAAVGWVPEKYMFIVMSLLGPSIYDLLQKYGKLMPSSALIIAKQALQGIENLHKLGFIHLDVTPSNFALGVNKYRQTLYIIDFDTSSCVPTEVLDEAPSSEGFVGTRQYASIAALKNKQQAQKDDIEGWLQVFIEVWNGTAYLWKDNETNERLMKRKQGFLYSEAGFIKKFMPEPFDRIAQHIKNLKYGERPDFEKLHKFMDEIYLSEGVKKPRAIDWDSEFLFSGPANVPLDNDQAYYLSSSDGFKLMHNGVFFIKGNHPSTVKGQEVFQCHQPGCRGSILVDEYFGDKVQNYQKAVISNILRCHTCGNGQISKENVRAQPPKSENEKPNETENAVSIAAAAVREHDIIQVNE